MNYGPHTADVLDLVDFIESGRLLRDPRPPSDPGLKIIRDLSELDRYREVQEDTPDDWWIWKDILEYAGTCGSDFPSERLRRLETALIDKLNKLYDLEIYDYLTLQLAGRFDEEVISNIWADFTFIIGYRAAFGRTLPFVERLIELWRLGGFPCGWDGGVHPQGRLVVYFPPEDASRPW